ncbi:uncharacterized protein LOC141851899 [Brevipalpus obovatus]|uniref:uncharacterized protein LOC141851899 n=1 Tax=Brevipalpus obovatus TaxID=246614 RepID=UPI003D9F0BFA
MMMIRHLVKQTRCNERAHGIRSSPDNIMTIAFFNVFCLILVIFTIPLVCGEGPFSSKKDFQNLTRIMRTVGDGYVVMSTRDLINYRDKYSNNDMAILTGFDGDEGLAVITKDQKILFTNFLNEDKAQAQTKERAWTVITSYDYTRTARKWVENNGLANQTMFYDMTSFTMDELDTLKSSDQRIKLISYWYPPDVTRLLIPVHPHPIQFTGISWQEKVEQLKAKLNLDSNNNFNFFVDRPDDVCWLMNIRARSQDRYSPVINSMLKINTTGNILYFPDEATISEDLKLHLKSAECFKNLAPNCVLIQNFRDIHRERHNERKGPTFTSRSASYYTLRAIDGTPLSSFPVEVMRSRKHPIELEGLRRAYRKESEIICQILYELETNSFMGKNITSIIDKLQELRTADSNFSGTESFPPTFAFGMDSAYSLRSSPTSYTIKKADQENFFSINTGAQYFDGTTGIARTQYLGEAAAAKQKIIYTQVLAGLIDVLNVNFPNGTMDKWIGSHLATQHLHRAGLDYRISIGHGVGSYLSFKEFPLSLDERFDSKLYPLESGQVFSVNVGVYEKSYGFGIQLSETAIVIENPNVKGSLAFEAIGRVPFEQKLILYELLDALQIRWLMDYNRKVMDSFKQKDTVSSDLLKWLDYKTAQSSETSSQPQCAFSLSSASSANLHKSSPISVLILSFVFLFSSIWNFSRRIE